MAIGKYIAAKAVYKRQILELGGNDPIIVLDDADLDEAAALAVSGSYKNSGQRCTAIKRMLVQRSVADRFVELLVDKTRSVKYGDPFDPAMDMGTVIDEPAAQRFEAVVGEAIAQGARLLHGNLRRGALYSPTVLDQVRPDMRVVAEETFGPRVARGQRQRARGSGLPARDDAVRGHQGLGPGLQGRGARGDEELLQHQDLFAAMVSGDHRILETGDAFMLIGVPKEIKNHEYRVGLTPSSVRELTAPGHQVLVERNAGAGIGAADAEYEQAGATIVAVAAELFARAEMIVKVKEPQAIERSRLRPGQLLFTYLHLAPDPQQCRELVESGAVCIAYETVTGHGGGLPLLAPMSEVVVIDRSVDALRRMDRLLGARVATVFSNRDNVEQQVLSADVVIGGVLIPGAAAPKLVSRDLLSRMKPGSVVVDVAIDQGGCFETARPTT